MLLVGLLATSIGSTAFAQTTRNFPRFPPNAIWNQDISAATPDPNSATITAASVGWGTGTTSFQIDFSMHTVYTAGQTTTSTPLVQEAGYYRDCDTGVSVPLPATGAIEGSTDYTCDLGEDCHLFVVAGTTLYESYKSTVDASGLNSLCLIKWRLDLIYPPEGRGEGCTSADAAGFPMAPLIFGPDEVYAAMQIPNGDLGHAIRFIMPNNRMRAGYYVHPASHNGSPSSSSPNALPYGARIRLKSNFDISHYNAAAQVILRTMKKYGMFLSDGGSVPLTFDDGLFATHQWSEAAIAIDSHSLFGVALSNFDVMPLGTLIAYDNNSDSATCVRNHFENTAQAVPTFPARILDTRAGTSTVDGLFVGGGPLAPKGVLDLTVAGRGNIPASGAVAAVFNLTATNTSATGFVTAWPTGDTRPKTSTLNFVPGQTVPNLVVAKLGTGGDVSIFNSAGNTDLIADNAWYFSAASQVSPLVPARLLDTRAGTSTVDMQFAGIGSIGPKQKIDLLVAGRGGVPSTPGAVILNVTATSPTAAGFITAWPAGQTRPTASNLNFTAGQTIANLVLAQVSATGYVSLYNSAGTTDLIADVTAWMPGGAGVKSLVPARLLDTRPGASTTDGLFVGSGALGPKGALDLTVVGRGGVPAGGVAAVVLNVTAVTPTAVGFITAWPTGNLRPSASNVNFVQGDIHPNLVVAAVGSNGAVTLFNSAGATHLVVDVVGWIAPGS